MSVTTSDEFNKVLEIQQSKTVNALNSFEKAKIATDLKALLFQI
jgi:hypothetical protein